MSEDKKITASAELTFEILEKAIQKAAETPARNLIRHVSPKEHKVITEMQKEGKLDNMGFPRNMEEVEEFFKRLKV